MYKTSVVSSLSVAILEEVGWGGCVEGGKFYFLLFSSWTLPLVLLQHPTRSQPVGQYSKGHSPPCQSPAVTETPHTFSDHYDTLSSSCPQ